MLQEINLLTVMCMTYDMRENECGCVYDAMFCLECLCFDCLQMMLDICQSTEEI